MLLHRQLNLLSYLGSKESFFLFGARGVGKSSLIGELISTLPSQIHLLEINLLKSDEYLRLLKSPETFRIEIESALSSQQNDETLLVSIDEIQKLPILLDEIHYLYERHKNRVQFILTGSSARKLKRSGANLLAGRANQEKLFPLTPFEIPNFNLNRALQFGTLPVAYLGSSIEYLKSYTETYLREEILQEAVLRNIEPFSRLLDLSSQFDGVNINFSQLARQINVSTKTAQSYFEILEDTLIATKIPYWSYSEIEKIIKSPKYYIFDTGVLNALSGELKTELKPASYRYGKLFENLVVNTLIRENSYLKEDNKFYNYRSNSGSEVDLIVARGPRDIPRAIEIKSQNAPKIEDLKSLNRLSIEKPDFKCFCLCQTPRKYNLENISILPWQEGIREILKLRE